MSQTLLATDAVYLFTIVTFKLAAGRFLLRFLVEPYQKLLLYGGLIIFTLFSMAFGFYTLFSCGVPKKNVFWIKRLSGECGSNTTGLGLGYTQNALDIATNLILICLPVPYLWAAKKSRRETMGLVVVYFIAIL
jgi:hypothetical protein